MATIFSSVFVVVFETNAYSQSEKAMERAATEVINMTERMKYSCIEMDIKGKLSQIVDKEQCKKFLDKVPIFELKELINKYHRASN